MDASEQAAEQLVRMTLQGTEYTLRLSGAGAKNLAAALMAIAKGHHQTKGKTRLKTLLDANKELKVFQLDAGDLKAFAQEAKKYGLLYTVVRPGKVLPGDMVDVMAKAEDAAKISRILDKLDLGKTDVADVVSEIEAAREQAGQNAADKGVEAKDEADRIVDELLAKPVAKDGADKQPPLVQKTDSRPPSEPTSANTARHSEGFTNEEGKDKPRPASKAKERGGDMSNEGRRSIKAEMEELRQSRKDAPKQKAQPQQSRNPQQPTRRARKPKAQPQQQTRNTQQPAKRARKQKTQTTKGR